MGATEVLAPVFAQIVLTFLLLFWMGKLRVAAVRKGEVHPGEVALGQPAWPPRIMQIGNAFRNQLELPILFYLVSLLALFTANATTTLVLLAWLFVATRYLHALIHVTTNNLARRFFFFFAGSVVLLAMWVVYFVQLYFGSSDHLPPLDLDAFDIPSPGQ